MAKKYLPATDANSGLSLPDPPGGKVPKGVAETKAKTYQDLAEEQGYAVKHAFGSQLIAGNNERALRNHADLGDTLEEIRDEPRGKWSQRHVNAMAEDVMELNRKHQLGLADAANFKIAETVERPISPEPKKPSWIEKKFGGGS